MPVRAGGYRFRAGKVALERTPSRMRPSALFCRLAPFWRLGAQSPRSPLAADDAIQARPLKLRRLMVIERRDRTARSTACRA